LAPVTYYKNPAKPWLKTGTFYVHKKVQNVFQQVFDEIAAAKIDYNFKKELHSMETFSCRYIKTPKGCHIGKYSSHMFGIAIDINPTSNPYTTPVSKMKYDIPKEVIEIFRKHGFRWGGDYGDAMHFEYCGKCRICE